MATPGRKPKPALAVVKEGNPGKRPIKDSVKLPPSALCEPDWAETLGEDVAATASALWRKLAPTLARSVGLVGEQQVTLEEYCTTVARIRQGELALTREGMTVPGAMGGQVKNPWTTVLNQYRSHLRSLTGELGLSPASASRITRPESGDDDDPFD
jgi:P27 family predicted phage terminase small subunit